MKSREPSATPPIKSLSSIASASLRRTHQLDRVVGRKPRLVPARARHDLAVARDREAAPSRVEPPEGGELGHQSPYRRDGNGARCAVEANGHVHAMILACAAALNRWRPKDRIASGTRPLSTSSATAPAVIGA